MAKLSSYKFDWDSDLAPTLCGPTYLNIILGFLGLKRTRKSPTCPAVHLEIAQDQGQQMELQVLSLDHTAASRKSFPVPYSPCTTLTGHTEGYGPFP